MVLSDVRAAEHCLAPRSPLDVSGIWGGEQQPTTYPQHAEELGQGSVDVSRVEMLEKLPRHDHIEALILERQRHSDADDTLAVHRGIKRRDPLRHHVDPDDLKSRQKPVQRCTPAPHATAHIKGSHRTRRYPFGELLVPLDGEGVGFTHMLIAV